MLSMGLFRSGMPYLRSPIQVKNRSFSTVPSQTSFSTLLHQSAMVQSPEDVRRLLDHLGEQAYVWAKTVNAAGKLPLEVARHNPRSKDGSIETLLFPYTISNTIPSLSQKINVVDVCAKYSSLPFRQLNMIKEAVNSINKSREIIGASGTHPSTNAMKSIDRLRLDQKIQHMRQSYSGSPIRIVHYQEAIKQILKNKIGNCSEFSYLSSDLLMKQNLPCSIEIISIEAVDHVFVVLNRPKNSDISNPLTWGTEAIIVDAWTGRVFLASEVLTHLMGFKFYYRSILRDEVFLEDVPNHLNLLVYFNPALHSLSLEYQFNPHLNKDGTLSYTLEPNEAEMKWSPTQLKRG